MWSLGQDVLWFYFTSPAPVFDLSRSWSHIPSGWKYPPVPATAAPEIHLMIESKMMPTVFTYNQMTQHSHPIAVTLCTAIKQVTRQHTGLRLKCASCCILYTKPKKTVGPGPVQVLLSPWTALCEFLNWISLNLMYYTELAEYRYATVD